MRSWKMAVMAGAGRSGRLILGIRRIGGGGISTFLASFPLRVVFSPFPAEAPPPSLSVCLPDAPPNPSSTPSSPSTTASSLRRSTISTSYASSNDISTPFTSVVKF